jgi:tRNA_anti-like
LLKHCCKCGALLKVMKKKLIISLAAVLILGAAAAYVYYGVLYKEGRNIAQEEAAVALPAAKLVEAYTANQQKADSLYLNKTIEVQGVVTAAQDSVLTVGGTVFCSFDQLPDKTSLNKTVTVKGRCIGFDELFGEVKLDQCTLLNLK